VIAALAVPALGAALGVAAYAYENVHQAWRPQVTSTAAGLRIVEPGGRHPGNPIVNGDHLAWTWAGDTIFMDLPTRESRLIGSARNFHSDIGLSVSDRYVVWVEDQSTPSPTVYAFDISAGRRFRPPIDVGPSSPVLVTGATALWIAGTAPGSEIRACDLATGERSVVAAGRISYPLLVDGDLVAWYGRPQGGLATGGPRPEPLVVMDMPTGTMTTVPPPPRDPLRPDAQTGWCDMSGGVLVGLATRPGSDANIVVTRDIASGTTRVVGTATPGTWPAIDGDTVVWLERRPGFLASTLVHGRRLHDGPAFVIARAAGVVDRVSLSGDQAAWLADGIAKSWIETAELPR
jgi:hypothetical protein